MHILSLLDCKSYIKFKELYWLYWHTSVISTSSRNEFIRECNANV